MGKVALTAEPGTVNETSVETGTKK